MSLAFDIAPVIERLRLQVPALRQVAGAAELASAIESGKGAQTPSAFVVLATEQGNPPLGLSSQFVQHVEVAVTVMLCVRNYARAALGAAAGADLAPILTATRAALLAWCPDGADDVFELASGRVDDFDAGTLWWQDVYRTRYRVLIT